MLVKILICFLPFLFLCCIEKQSTEPETKVEESFINPDGLKLLKITESNVTLSWKDNTTNESSFEIEQAKSGESFQYISSVSANDTVCSIGRGPYLSNLCYYFRVRATRSNGNPSDYSNTLMVGLDFQPDSLRITKAEDIRLELNWCDNSDFETSFEIEQSINDAGFSRIAKVSSNITKCLLKSYFANNSKYTFRVRAISNINKSEYSNEILFQKRSDLDFVSVQGGIFQMGFGQQWDTVHTVTLSDFKIAKYEVTIGEYNYISDWAIGHGYDLRNITGLNGHPKPVGYLVWYEMIKWCNAKSEHEGLTPFYYKDPGLNKVYRTGEINISNDCVKWDANGYRLPTEAEWEYAARGGLIGLPANHTYSGSNIMEEVAWDLFNGTHEVGTKLPNELGIYDMSGNAYEWVWDLYNRYRSDNQVDPKGPDEDDENGNDLRVVRGQFDGKVVDRHLDWAGQGGWHCGFRCVKK